MRNPDYSTIKFTTNFHDYGTITGAITLSPRCAPRFEKEMFCEDCKESILTVIPDYDIFLFDLKDHTIYDLCKENYGFSIRDYLVKTKAIQDDIIDFTITDKKL